MAKVKITGHASGTGILTVTAPNTSSDRTITLPDETGTLSVGSSIDDNGNATAITIDSSENVGIGVTPEAWTTFKVLQVAGEGVFRGHTDANEDVAIERNVYYDGSWKRINTAHAQSILLDNAGDILFKVAASGSADAAISWTNALTMKQDGRGLSQFTAKAWANYKGTDTNEIRDSHNISSVTDVGTGDYQFMFSNDMANDDYAVTCAGHDVGRIVGLRDVTYTNIEYVRLACTPHSGGLDDAAGVYVTVFGD